MNNDLKQFSEERLKLLELKVNYPTWDEISALARIALAVKQAKPVITCYACRKVMTRDQHAEADGFCPNCDVEIELDDDDTYTTPQPAHTEVNSPVIPDGWKLVPIEPTEAMCDVKHIGVDVFVGEAEGDEPYSIDGDSAGKVYRSMLAAAPKPESE